MCYRGDNNECLFLRVDIMLQSATFFVVFSNADDMPPPYRIDNFSEVAPLDHKQLPLKYLKILAHFSPSFRTHCTCVDV